jgi:hypothetical protein
MSFRLLVSVFIIAVNLSSGKATRVENQQAFQLSFL